MNRWTTADTLETGAPRMLRQMRVTFWLALLLMAGMAVGSYALLGQRIAEHQADLDIITLANSQRTLSQRIPLLVQESEAGHGETRDEALRDLERSIDEFESSYETLLRLVDPDSTTTTSDGKPSAVATIFFGRPYYLDHFTIELVSVGRRFVAAARRDNGGPEAYSAEHEKQRIDSTVARATLIGYAALRDNFTSVATQRLDSLVSVHRWLFLATLGLILLIAAFIFHPMTKAIARRTEELLKARNSMAYVAAHDRLTGLYNRSFLMERFEAMIRAADRERQSIAIIQIDLDRFKAINDTMGHAVGDIVLSSTASRMLRLCGPDDICVRLGGDEFLILMPVVRGRTHAADFARAVLDAINEPVICKGASINPGASAGIALYPGDGDTPTDLMIHADLALYNAKRLGGGACVVFSDELRAELDHGKAIERELRQAIEERAFEAVFQPQVSLRSGAVTGLEALLRWRHPERGVLAPGQFLAIAERAGLMSAIGRQMIDDAIGKAAVWHRAGIEFGRLAVNVSGAELREADFPAFLFGTIERHGLPASKLSLEIVESVILDDEKTGIAAKLRRIRRAGIHLELDDFGTGYASLSHVNPNEIDRLKIDRRFVRDMHLNEGNAQIVRAITELARNLGIDVVAEGAETQAELDCLTSLGCDAVQGYAIAFPMPAEACRAWLQARAEANRPQARVARIA